MALTNTLERMRTIGKETPDRPEPGLQQDRCLVRIHNKPGVTVHEPKCCVREIQCRDH